MATELPHDENIHHDYMPKPYSREPRTPIVFDHFVRLESIDELDDKTARDWYHVVKEYAPSGTPTGYSTPNAEGEASITTMLHSATKSGKHWYDIPLTRDLLDNELTVIGNAFNDRYTGKDWVYSCSGIQPEMALQDNSPPEWNMDDQDWQNFCIEMAKAAHNAWVAEMVNRGWHWGLKRSDKNKSHPMMRPWDQLPEMWRKVDDTVPNRVRDLLHQQGFEIVSSDWLERLKNKPKE